jgi:hypothetical protein
VSEQAAGDVSAMQASQAPARTEPNPAYAAVREAVAAYREDGPGGLRERLATHPSELSALATLGAADLEDALERELSATAEGLRTLITGLDADTMRGVLQSVASAKIRQAQLREAGVVVNARLRNLEALREGLPERLPALRGAAPGTALAVEAELLGVRGDEGDLARAEASIDRSASGLRAFLNRMRGQSWEPGEFPASAGRAARRLGLDGPRDSAGSLAQHDAETAESDVSTALHGVDAVHMALEARHLSHLAGHATATSAAEFAAGAVGLSVSVVGLAVGAVVHHYAEEAHQAHLRFGRALGL